MINCEFCHQSSQVLSCAQHFDAADHRSFLGGLVVNKTDDVQICIAAAQNLLCRQHPGAPGTHQQHRFPFAIFDLAFAMHCFITLVETSSQHAQTHHASESQNGVREYDRKWHL